MVKISEVTKGSPAAKAGLLPGDYIISINDNEINDVLDYRFYLTEKKVKIKIHRESELFDVLIKKDEYADIGLDFETFLMDKKHSCRNKCIFCFIDQLPGGMRETLYFKDDDSRLSFLQGNYITLTNLSESEIKRICDMKLSPMNVSVHTTNPVLRCDMLKNKNAGNVMDTLRSFAESGIKIHAQIVLCRDVNDKAELDLTMRDLASLYPSLESCSIVPAGLTRYRDGLYPLKPFSKQECAEIIAQVTEFSNECLEKYGSRIFFAADEFYIKSETELPDNDSYEGYPQIENGVGLITSMKTEFESELEYIDEYNIKKEKHCSIATGEAAFGFISSLVEKLSEICYNLDCKVYCIENEFFGENITVAGLITGGDLISQLKGKEIGDTLYIPSVMLRSGEDVFLDDISVSDVEGALGVKVKTIKNDGAAFIASILE